MAFTLSDLLQGAYKKLGQYQSYLATAGTTTTTIVGGLAAIDSLKEGTLFVVRDSAGAGAAPEGQFQAISAYTKATGTFAHAAVTVAVASGDTVAIVNNLYPVRTMIELANDALRALGDIVLVDTTTLDSASDKTEYALDTEWKRNIRRVDLQTITTDANDNQWQTIYEREEIPATAGSDGLLVLDQLPADRDIRIWYDTPHPTLTTYSSVVHEKIHPELATWALVVEALSWQWHRGRDEDVAQDLSRASVELNRVKSEFPIDRPKRVPRYLTLPRSGDDSEYTGEVNSVRTYFRW